MGYLLKIIELEPDYPPAGWIPDTTYNEYDLSGNVDLGGKRQWYWNDNPELKGADRRASQSYYGADNRLMVQQTYQDSLNYILIPQVRRGMYEEYWYDALGRRVLVRRRADSLCTTSLCYSTMERFVWDGDQLLYELRYPGWDDLSPAALDWKPPRCVSPYVQHGTVGYSHGPGIDRPLDLIRQ
ncbi:MAG: hypothetical protein GTO22_10540, partial [Gemmatimonadales bacterium]|nr:hypothetical protein [Gemmatimonadales bacterium]